MRRGAIPIVVFASGRGSNFEAIHRATQDGRLPAEIVAVLSDQSDALVLEKAKSLGLNAIHVPVSSKVEIPDLHKRREEHELRILKELERLKPEYLVMAGYMRVLTSTLIEAYRTERGVTRLVNVHPSLLPAFPGIQSYEQVWNHGCKVAGVTVHLVDTVVDGGPICAQEAFSIEQCVSAEEVEQKGLSIEHRLYPETLSWVIQNQFEVDKVRDRYRIVRSK